VQLSTFGRVVEGQADELVGFRQSLIEIADPAFVAETGKSHHAVVKFDGNDDSRVSGTVLELSAEELARADAYEPDGYRRVEVTLASGKQAWVYADAR
jgi:gamma-glutamylcyclotransferase (GGCT)/AIG2-like uncharacterized protein YtfP